MKIEEKKKKNKHCSSITYTTGDPAFNIKMFNKHFGTDRGYFSGTIKPEAATQADTFLAASPDGANSVSLGGGESSGAGDAGAADGAAHAAVYRPGQGRAGGDPAQAAPGE